MLVRSLSPQHFEFATVAILDDNKMESKKFYVILQLMLNIFGAVMLIQMSGVDSGKVHANQYTTETFESEVAKGNHFIMFYSPWDENYSELGPQWERLAQMIKEQENSRVRIAKVDCTTDRNICWENDVTRYTRMKFFKAGESVGVEYFGETNVQSFMEFINEQLKYSLTEMNSSAELTNETFNDHISSGRHFVQFYAPRSGQCQKLVSTWNELVKNYIHDTSVSISRIDCSKYRSVCDKFNIRSYPTFLWIENGKEIDEYLINHADENLQEYSNKMIRNNELNTINRSVSTTNGESFELGNEKGLTFIHFFAPWDGYSKHVTPIWKELEIKFLDNKLVHIVKIDCTLTKKNVKFCDEQMIPGFPRFFLYNNGIFVADFLESRTPDEFYKFVNNFLQSRDEL